MLAGEHHPSQGINDACVESAADQNNLGLELLERGLHDLLESERVGRPSAARRKRNVYIVVLARIGADFRGETRVGRVVPVLVD